MMRPTLSIAGINAMDRQTFVARFGGIYERSPWIAERAWDSRPFAGRDALERALEEVVLAAGADRQRELLQMHPRLGTRTELSGYSRDEQEGAGLLAAQAAERAELERLSHAYEKKFGFPFILAVRAAGRRTILDSCATRLDHDARAEFDESLRQVLTIARFRLHDLVTDSECSDEMTSPIQVLGISNAIVDVLAHVEESFLEEIGAPKKSMVLIDTRRAEEIYARMGPATEASGGSVANTIAGIANLGGRTAYIGRVRDDQLGRIFIHDMKSLGVDVRLAPVSSGPPTARSYILITPDGERTMQTYLGAAAELGPEDVTPETFGRPRIVLLEGYLWDLPPGRAATANAIALAKRTAAQVALSLSDSWCVERHREDFAALIGRDVKLVFANETEIMSLFEVKDFDAAIARVAQIDALFAITRSGKGSVVVQGRQRIVQPAYPVAKVVDATGAGDAYTAAFLYAHTSGRSPAECADLGSRAATAVIQQVGPRVQKGALA